MKKVLLFLVSCFLMCNSIGLAQMKKEGPGKMMHHEMKGKMCCPEHYKGECSKGDGLANKYLMLSKELNLTNKQKTDLNNIITNDKKQDNLKEAEIKNIKLDFENLLKQNPPNFKSAKSKVQAMYDVKLKNKLSSIDSQEKAYNVLTKEQKDKLPEAMETLKEKCKEKHKKSEKKEMQKE